MASVGKLLLLLFLALIGFILMKGLKARDRRKDSGVARRGPAAERMVACAHCGVNLPESESVRAGGRHFCSEEHRRLSA